jgi:hypothetical protein
VRVIAERANIPLTALTILKCELKWFAGVGHQGVSSEQDAMPWLGRDLQGRAVSTLIVPRPPLHVSFKHSPTPGTTLNDLAVTPRISLILHIPVNMA